MRTILLLLFLTCTVSYAQDTVSFTYDSAGNQIIRNLICISCDDECPTCRKMDARSISQNMIESEDFADISYFPNPVEEELHIKWSNAKDNYVTALEVYTIGGQKVAAQANLSNTETTLVEFRNASQGIYIVSLMYSNGETKALKIIKK